MRVLPIAALVALSLLASISEATLNLPSNLNDVLNNLKALSGGTTSKKSAACGKQTNGYVMTDSCTKLWDCSSDDDGPVTWYTGCKDGAKCVDDKCKCVPGPAGSSSPSLGEMKCPGQTTSTSSSTSTSSAAKVECDSSKGFRSCSGKCILVVPQKATYDAADADCTRRGLTLLKVNTEGDLDTLKANLLGDPVLKSSFKSPCWFGGIKSAASALSTVQTSSQSSKTSLIGGLQTVLKTAFSTSLKTSTSSNSGSLFAGLFANMGVSLGSLSSGCGGCVAGQRTAANKKACPELQNKGLELNFGVSSSINFKSSSETKPYACELPPQDEDDDDEDSCQLSAYFNSDNPSANGEFELRLAHLVASITQKKPVCTNPKSMKIRIKGTQTYLDDQNTQGYKFTYSARKGFYCYNKDQAKGKTCPDVEVAYCCPVNKDGCDDEDNKAECDKQNRDCVDLINGGHYCRVRIQQTANVKTGRCCQGKFGTNCTDTCVCTASGDPHIDGCDGAHHDFMGRCTTTYMENVNPVDGCPVFAIQVEHRTETGSIPTWIKKIMFSYNDHKVVLDQKKYVVVDDMGVKVPYNAPDGSFSIINEGCSIKLIADFCLAVTWDGDRSAKFQPPSACKTKIRGMCGNYDGILDNDYTLKSGELASAKLTRSQRSAAVGNSFEVPNPASTSTECQAAVLNECTKDQLAKFSGDTYCGILTNANGPFKSYVSNAKTKTYLQSQYDNCIQDACNSLENDRCPLLESIVMDLANMDGKAVSDAWRPIANCRVTCQANSTYASSMSPCQPTCADDEEDDIQPDDQCPDPRTITGCKCNEGYVLSGTRCVLRSECGCQTPEGYLEPGDEIVDSDCNNRYKCAVKSDGSITLITEPYGDCDEHASCKKRECVCNEGYTGNGKSCTQQKVSCPTGYTQQGSGCYLIDSTLRNWMDAMYFCGVKSGGYATLCPVHVAKHLTDLTDFLAKKKLQTGCHGAGNGVAQKKDVGKNLATTPSRALPQPDKAGCDSFQLVNGNLDRKTGDCATKRPTCCYIDPSVKVNQTYTPLFPAYQTPTGSSISPSTAIDKGLPVCSTPSAINCVTADGKPFSQSGLTGSCNAKTGFVYTGLKPQNFKVSFQCPKDDDECSLLGSDACSGGKQCVNVIGAYKCQCPGTMKENDQGVCYDDQCGTCTATGDPHFTIINGKRYTYQSLCLHTLVETIPSVKGKEPPCQCISIATKNTKCGKEGQNVTCTFYVQVTLYKRCSDMGVPNVDAVVVRLDRNGVYSYAGKSGRKDAISTPDFSIARDPATSSVILTTRCGFIVSFRGTTVTVKSPPGYENFLRGLCGNCAQKNSFPMPSGPDLPITVKNGNVLPAIVQQLAAAYQIDDPNDPACTLPKPDVQPQCSDAAMAVLGNKSYCGFMDDTRFDFCRENADAQKQDCIYDLCAYYDRPELEDEKCRKIADLVETCRESQGQNAPQLPWRSATFCPMPCPSNETYSDIASADSLCGASEGKSAQSPRLVESCKCLDGLKRDTITGQCVDPSKCGCDVSYSVPDPTSKSVIVKSYYLPSGAVGIAGTDCTQVKCLGDNNLQEQPQRLDPVNGKCDIASHPPKPGCQKGFDGDGYTCKPNNDCKEPFNLANGKCMYFSTDKLPASGAISRCIQMGAVLGTCETEDQCDNFGDFIGKSSYYIRGQMIVTNNKPKPVCDEKKVPATTKGSEHYQVPKLPDSLQPLVEGEYRDGTTLCFALSNDGASTSSRLVDCKIPLNFVCVQRRPDEPQEYTSPCSSDNAANGDQCETTDKLIEAGCKTCLYPSAVNCSASGMGSIGNQVSSCKVEGKKVYSCQSKDQKDGRKCSPVKVSLLCPPNVDECKLGLHNCPEGSDCIDLYDGFRCKCAENTLEVDGKCKPVQKCSLQNSPTGGHKLNSYKNFLLTFATRCQYNMASINAGDNKPSINVNVESINEVSNPGDYNILNVSVELKSPKGNCLLEINKELLDAGRVALTVGDASRSEVSLPHDGLSDSFDLQLKAGSDKRLIIARKDLDIEICLLSTCSNVINIVHTTDYGTTGGACSSSSSDQSGDKTTLDILNKYISKYSRVSCSPPTVALTPPPPVYTTTSSPAATTTSTTKRTTTARPPNEKPNTAAPEVTTNTYPPNPSDTNPATEKNPVTTKRPSDTTDKTVPASKSSSFPGRPTTQETPERTTSNEAPPTTQFPPETTAPELQLPQTLPPETQPPEPQTTPPVRKPSSSPENEPQPSEEPTRPSSAPNVPTTTPESIETTDDYCESTHGGDDKCGILRKSPGPFSRFDISNQEYRGCLEASCSEGHEGFCRYLKNTARKHGNMTYSEKRTAIEATLCVPPCPENMRFSFFTHGGLPTCQNIYELTPNANADEMGCVCDLNFILSGGKCVPKSDCGCTIEGIYYEKGSKIVSKDCTKSYSCNGGNDVIEFNHVCPDNSECNGNGQCDCREGFFGDCCHESIDLGNMTCYKKCDGSQVCTCKMGFSAFCDSCIDSDECLTHEHKCESNEKCINEIGGYTCECAHGYRKDKYTNKCKNINECAEANDEGRDLCGNGARCVDKDGFYECSCCAGYKPSADGCKASANIPADAACCACQGPNCLIIGKFCYTEADGSKITYESYKDMYETRCLAKLPVMSTNYVSRGCDEPEVGGKGPSGPSGPSGPPGPPGACNDDLCSEEQKRTPPGGAVCQRDPEQEFPSVCAMVKAACAANKNHPVPAVPAYKNGKCKASTPPPENRFTFTTWNTWSTCNSQQKDNCQGLRVRERQKVSGEGQPTERQVREVEKCTVPACSGKTTPAPENGDCGNPVDCPNSNTYICAKVGNNAEKKTYLSSCHLRIAACRDNETNIIIFHDGRCLETEEHPVHLPCEGSAIPHQVLIVDSTDENGVHCLGQTINVGVCESAFCHSQDASVCCQAAEIEYLDQLVVCRNAANEVVRQETRQVPDATRCECRPKNAPAIAIPIEDK